MSEGKYAILTLLIDISYINQAKAARMYLKVVVAS
jgi:hypothetical protein